MNDGAMVISIMGLFICLIILKSGVCYELDAIKKRLEKLEKHET